MHKRELSLNELKDSRLLYEKDMPAFGYLLLILLLLLMTAITFWGVKTTKPYIVKGTGAVESPNRNYVMTPFTGEISGVAIKEGDYVNEGDELFTVKSTECKISECDKYKDEIRKKPTMTKEGFIKWVIEVYEK